MKFYYNGQVIRTSKTHVYTHAVINTNTGECKGCRSNRKGAEQIISSEISAQKSNIEDVKAQIKALEQGKRIYRCKCGKRSYYEKIWNSKKELEEWLAAYENRIKNVTENWKVVELEAR